MNAYKLSLIAHDLARTTGGFTLNSITGSAPTSGYVVGGVVPEKRVPWSRLASYGIEDYICAHRRELLDGYGYLGGWIIHGETEEDQLVLDVCSLHSSKEDALDIARKHSQEAIYCLDTKETIFLEGVKP